jgi:hypothetical protein
LGFGLELFELLEGTLAGTASAVEAPLELAEGFGLMAGGLAEGIFVIGLKGVAVVVCPELGFGGTEAALEPLAVDEVVDEGAGFGGGGMVALVVLGDEEFEIGESFGREDEGLGVDAGFEGVHGGSGLACSGGGAGGVLGVAAVGFYLTESRHGGSGSELRSGCPSFARMDKAEPYPTLRIEARFGGFGGGWRQVAGNRGRRFWMFVKR